MTYRKIAIFQIVAVSEDYERASSFVRISRQQALGNPRFLQTLNRSGIIDTHINNLLVQMGPMYLIRIFAKFENVLRNYRQSIGKSGTVKTQDLIDSIAGRHGISGDDAGDVHDVRRYRNSLIHEEHRTSREISVVEARASLSKFLSFLPDHW
jgi:hypothetical protein